MVPSFPIVLIVQRRKILKFQARNPISSKHIFFWCPFLEPHWTIYQSNIGVIIRKIVEQGLSTLPYMEPDMWKFGHLYFERIASHKSALLY